MTPVERVLPDVHVALEGHFNPLILQPDWLLRQGLIDEQDRADVLEQDAAVISPEFAGARYSWVTVETTRTSMSLSSTPGSEAPDRVRELAIGILSVLSHTPITSLTVSYSWHFQIDDEQWRAITDALAPRGPLKDLLGGDIQLQTVGQRSVREDGEVALYVEPSMRDDYIGFMQVDETHTLDEDQSESASRALEIIGSRWDDVRGNAEAIFKALFDQ